MFYSKYDVRFLDWDALFRTYSEVCGRLQTALASRGAHLPEEDTITYNAIMTLASDLGYSHVDPMFVACPPLAVYEQHHELLYVLTQQIGSFEVAFALHPTVDQERHSLAFSTAYAKLEDSGIEFRGTIFVRLRA